MYNAGGDDLNVAFLDKDLNAHRNLLHRNCDSVLQAAYRFGGPMVARGRGAVVLVTSGAAWAGAATLATYSATKAFDLILAEASGRSGATAGSTCSGSSSAGPTWIYGSQNPTGGSPFGAMSRRDAVLLMSRGATHRNNDPSQPSTLQAAWRTRRAAVADSTIGDGVAQVRGTRASDIIKTWATF